MKLISGWTRLLRAGMVVAVATMMSAQIETTQKTSSGTPTHEVQVERAEVLTVSGNDVILKMEDGSIRHITNVSENKKVDVDGRQVGIHELRPGMKLQHTITTTSTPQVITTVQTVTGKVWHVQPPHSVILTLENGENQKFKVPENQKFMVNGEEKDVFHLKKGMVVKVTKVVEEPLTVVERQKKLTGTMPPPPPVPPADVPVLVASAAPTPALAEAEAAPTTLPKTGSELPLLFTLGTLLVAGAGTVRRFRR